MLVKPIVKKFKYYIVTPADVYRAVKEQTKSKYTFLLESCEGDEKVARYSFVGFTPIGRISIDKTGTSITGNIFSEDKAQGKDPIDIIKNCIGHNLVVNSKESPRFLGGAVGYFSYDLIRSWLPYFEDKSTALKTPDAEFIFTKDNIAFDHTTREIEIVSCAFGRDEVELKDDVGATENRLQEVEEVILSAERGDITFREPKKIDSSSNTTKAEFEKMVEKSKEYIRAGDIFQVVVSKRICADAADPYETYLALKTLNPSPYLYYLEFGDLVIAGSSPEMLVRVEGNRVITRPIAGTIRRGRTEMQDRGFASEMLNDPKERAEHVMLVDLHRNDIGKVCKYGTVQASELMIIERFSHVQHIVSTVEGVLNEKSDAYDALRGTFPAGTVSGAPKVRAMEIINELEKERRGPYAGAVGYFGLDGNMDFAITIRTLIQKANKAYVQAGSGIVADSMPEKEWFESENKAKALMKALMMVS
ncbi:MAG: anthranilate synthase component I [Candidatus Helarchaeota archaeon]|nr:anthranilate synthase component I [Candidatus Helarchaeota archaeon]